MNEYDHMTTWVTHNLDPMIISTIKHNKNGTYHLGSLRATYNKYHDRLSQPQVVQQFISSMSSIPLPISSPVKMQPQTQSMYQSTKFTTSVGAIPVSPVSLTYHKSSVPTQQFANFNPPITSASFQSKSIASPISQISSIASIPSVIPLTFQTPLNQTITSTSFNPSLISHVPVASALDLSSVKVVTQLLTGPYTLTVHYNRELERIIYVFGEKHGIKESCPDQNSQFISDYLYNLFKDTSVPIDFYLEAQLQYIIARKILGHMRKLKQPESIDHIQRLEIALITDYSQLPMVRGHFIDPRDGITRSSFGKIGILDIMTPHLTREKANESVVPSFVQEIFNSVDISTPEKYLAYTEELLRDQENYVGKEIARSTKSEDIITFTLETALLMWMIYYPILDAYFKPIETNKLLRSHHGPGYLDKLTIAIIKMNSVMLDAYTLARMFKKFNMQNRPREGGGSSPLFTDTPTYMIFYGGNAHSDAIRSFLYTQGFEQTESATMYKIQGIELQRCLDISHIKQPFFTSYL